MLESIASLLQKISGGLGTPAERDALTRAVAEEGGIHGVGAITVDGDATGSTLTTNVQIGGTVFQVTLTPEVIAALMPPPPVASTLFNLPDVPPAFVGRAAPEARLLADLSRGRNAQAIVGLRGIGGIGKTALAARVARQLALHFPDARFAVDLRGSRDNPATPRAAMEEVIRRFEPTAGPLPEDDGQLGELYRGLLATKRALILLDDARDTAQVTPLLPPAPSAAIITSRTLIDLAAGESPIRLGALSRGEAVSLLATLVRSPECSTEALEDLADACADHPLALTVAGRWLAPRLDYVAVADYVAEIRENRERLRLEGDPDHDVMGSLDLSLRGLAAVEPDLAERWRDLSVFVGAFTTEQADRVAGLTDASTDAMRRLCDLGLLDPAGAPGRYRLHDLMRDLARRGQLPDRFNAPADRHSALFLEELKAAGDLFDHGGSDNILAALAAFDAARADIEAGRGRAVARLKADGDAGETMRYAGFGVYVTNLRLHPRRWITWLEDGLASARAIGDRYGEGNTLGNLGLAHARLGNVQKAIEFHERALVISKEIGDRRAESQDLGNLGLAHADLGDARKAIEFYEAVLEIAREIGDRRGEGNALGNLGLAHAALGDARKAIEFQEGHLEIARKIGDRRGEGNALGNLGLAHAALGDARKAIEFQERASVISKEIGDRRGEGNTLGNLGLAHAALGDARKAIEFHQAWIEIAREIGDRHGEGNALGNLGNAYADLGDARKAIEFHERALVISKEIGDRRAESHDLGNLGLAYRDLGQPDDARRAWIQALAIFEQIESPHAQSVRDLIAQLDHEDE